MKKLVVALCAVVMGISVAKADFVWSWWTSAPAENASKDVEGCAMGFASEVASIKGVQAGLLYNIVGEVKGGAQISIGYNRATTVKNGPQVAFVNVADAAALQFGLLCFNKEGFLPFFPFFNFSKKMFGAVD